jgi:hypothetical protein
MEVSSEALPTHMFAHDGAHTCCERVGFDNVPAGLLGSGSSCAGSCSSIRESGPVRASASAAAFSASLLSSGRMSEKHTRFLGRHSAMRVGMRIDAARTSRFERLQN